MSEEEKKKRMDQEKRAFIKEQTASNKKKNIRKTGYRFLIIALAAAVFGIIAGATFVLSSHWMKKILGDDNGNPSATEKAAVESDLSSEQVSGDKEKEQDAKKDDSETAKKDSQGDKDVQESSEQSGYILRQKDMRRMAVLLEEYGQQKMHSIVQVSKVKATKDWFDNPSVNKESTYGVVLEKDSERMLVLTESEIVQEDAKLQVVLENEEVVSAKMISSCRNLGIAILEVSLQEVPDEIKENVTSVRISNAATFNLAETVILAGKVNGFFPSMEWGQISTQSTDASVMDHTLKLYHVALPYEENGAGVVFNLRGELIGIITNDFPDLMGESEVSFVAMGELRNNILRMKQGKNLRYIGILGTDVQDNPDSDIDVESGVYVTEVKVNTPAYMAGMRTGDVIIGLGDEEITSIYELNEVLQSDILENATTIKVVRTTGRQTGEKKLKITCEKWK